MPQFKTDFGLHYMAACNDNYNLCAPQEAGDGTPGSQIEYRRIHKNDKKKLKKSGSQKSILKNEPTGQNDNLSNFKRDIEVNKTRRKPDPYFLVQTLNLANFRVVLNKWNPEWIVWRN